MPIINKNINAIEKKEVIGLLQSNFHHRLHEEIWEWEFESFGNKVIKVCAKDNNEIVGTLFALPIYLNLNGQVILSGKEEKAYLSTEYRGRSVFVDLYKKLECDSLQVNSKLLWAFSPVGVKVFRNKLKHRVFKDVMRKSKIPISTLNNFNFFHWKFLFKLYRQFQTKKKFKQISKSIDYKERLHEFEVRDEVIDYLHFDKLFQKVRELFGIKVHIQMTREYIDWRVNNNPNLNYIQKYFYKEKELKGYYIVSIKNGNARIADWVFIEKTDFKYMQVQMYQQLKRLSVTNAYYMANDTNMLSKEIFNEIKKLSGSTNIEPQMHFIYKNIGKLEGLPDSSNQWYINGLWTEGFGI